MQVRLLARHSYVFPLVKISHLRLTNGEDLKTAISDRFYEIKPLMSMKMSKRTWTRMKQCTENGGQNTDVL